MFANNSLRYNSVINYDMLYKYVFSSTTGYGYSVYEDIQMDMFGKIGNDSIKSVVKSNVLSGYGFTMHTGYNGYPTNSAMRVGNSIALNPYISLLEIVNNHCSATATNGALEEGYDVRLTASYVLTFSDGTEIYASAVTNEIVCEEGDSVSFSVDYVTYKDDNGAEYTFDEIIDLDLGDIESIKFIGYGKIDNDDRVGLITYGKDTFTVKFWRGEGYLYSESVELHEGEEVVINDVFTPEFVVRSNAQGASKTNAFVEPNFDLTVDIWVGSTEMMTNTINYTIIYDISGDTHDENTVVISVNSPTGMIYGGTHILTPQGIQMRYTGTYSFSTSASYSGAAYNVATYFSPVSPGYSVRVTSGGSGNLQPNGVINVVVTVTYAPAVVYDIKVIATTDYTYGKPYWAFGMRGGDGVNRLGGESAFTPNVQYRQQYSVPFASTAHQGEELSFYFDNYSTDYAYYDSVALLATDSQNLENGAHSIGDFVDMTADNYTFDINDFPDPSDPVILVWYNFYDEGDEPEE